MDQSVVMNGWKLIYDWNGSFLAFDLNEDPTERDPITDPNDPEVRALWSALEPQVEALEALYTLGEPVDPGI